MLALMFSSMQTKRETKQEEAEALKVLVGLLRPILSKYVDIRYYAQTINCPKIKTFIFTFI